MARGTAGIRAFIVKSDTAYVGNGPPFKSGRLDVMLNSAISAITRFSNGKVNVRRGVEFFMVMPLNDPPIISIESSNIGEAPMDEGHMLSLLIDGLARGGRGVKGIRGDLESLLRSLRDRDFKFLYLHEDGVPIRSAGLEGNIAFILGDQDGLSANDERLIKRHGIPRVSLGSMPYMTWECVSILNAIMDGAISLASD